jgi:hypothetical protein
MLRKKGDRGRERQMYSCCQSGNAYGSRAHLELGLVFLCVYSWTGASGCHRSSSISESSTWAICFEISWLLEKRGTGLADMVAIRGMDTSRVAKMTVQRVSCMVGTIRRYEVREGGWRVEGEGEGKVGIQSKKEGVKNVK